MMKKFCFLLGSILLFLACEQGSTTTEVEASVTNDEVGDIASIIRNPVTADSDEVDTSQLAKMEFDTTTFNFGSVDPGAIVTHDFEFTNTGNVPLIISDVRSTCGCTVAEWPREPIPPGGTGEIPVRFDTKNKKGIQSKPVTITANTFPAKTVLYLNGRVEE